MWGGLLVFLHLQSRKVPVFISSYLQQVKMDVIKMCNCFIRNEYKTTLTYPNDLTLPNIPVEI